ncbi:hypothetical protein ANCCAN_20253 [Ancylostoma caninum]|uniref:Neurotransmitter-gated ion-channel ligand-binding domain-containing protein n=1 Tax=Ancylostoma caninum TaxID=29170 RepID=A0A368FUI3_ANCCA|nr:hypothetical protein ANCCAN_20253 [Ancylostoma caninum]
MLSNRITAVEGGSRLLQQSEPKFLAATATSYRTLMKNYSAIVRPVRNPNKIWNDYRLRWRPLAFDNISSVRFPGDEQQIWQPDILLYNRHAN